MKKYLNCTVLFGVLIAFLGGCEVSNSATVSKQYEVTVQPTVDTSGNAKSEINDESNTIDDKNIDEGNEIKQCSPEKIYQGEIIEITFNTSHGKKFAIYNEKTRDFYFLTENAPYYFPQISPDEFEKLESIKLDTSKVRSSSDEIGSDGYNKSKLYFDRTGWYRVIVGHQALDVDFADMTVTGSCRIYYVNEKRPREK